MDQKPLAVILTGPTAVGKTRLSFGLSDALNGTLISVDSAQVYRGMDIGTAKPDAATLQRYPHRLIDIRDPADPYSAADFRRDCLREIDDIVAAGRTPLLVGGTMLYLKVLLEGLAELPQADAAVRDEVARLATEQGWPAVHAELQRVDPITAARLKPTDSQRLQRALEVYRVSGRALSAFHAEQAAVADLPCRFVQLALIPERRALLHARIETRFRQMLKQGFVAEVEALFRRGDLDPTLPSIRSVGYRQVWSYLAGDDDYDTMIEKGLAATRQLAKRQHTWLRSWPDLHRLILDETGSVVGYEGPAGAPALPPDQLDAAISLLGLHNGNQI